MQHNQKKQQLNTKIDQVMSDKNRIEGFKKMLENQTVNKILQNQELDSEIDQLQ